MEGTLQPIDLTTVVAPGDTVASKSNSMAEAPIKITITIPTNAYFMSGLRDFTMNLVRNMTGFSEQWAYRFQSVIDELVNNAIEFGSAPGKDVKITFISQRGKSIDISVEDTGTGPSKKSAEELAKLVEDRRHVNPLQITSIRGRGLAQIVANWTDVLEFKNTPEGGLVVHVIKHLEAGEQL
ncbi:sensor histidine kinase [Candidatus Peregrinibacteria bacterium]|nr:sensor histidine kinase [Candidatus Peregrinibacteria bacterium]